MMHRKIGMLVLVAALCALLCGCSQKSGGAEEAAKSLVLPRCLSLMQGMQLENDALSYRELREFAIYGEAKEQKHFTDVPVEQLFYEYRAFTAVDADREDSRDGYYFAAPYLALSAQADPHGNFEWKEEQNERKSLIARMPDAFCALASGLSEISDKGEEASTRTFEGTWNAEDLKKIDDILFFYLRDGEKVHLLFSLKDVEGGCYVERMLVEATRRGENASISEMVVEPAKEGDIGQMMPKSLIKAVLHEQHKTDAK